ncbi:MAG: septum formation family protein [Chloroflexi bacterium]|nr:septum formation family protein [Chloroflexota bacterium]
MTRERDRYPRMTLRDQVDEVVDWVRTNRVVVIVGLIGLAVLAFAFWPPAAARPEDLRVGDCLYVRTSASSAIGPSAHPIGEPGLVEAALMTDGAQRTDCGASHGHEVAAIVELPDGPPAGPGIASLRLDCEAAFAPYVGRPLESSIYGTFAATPTTSQWDAGIHRAICLVARTDGEWMSHPARGSGE